MKLLLLPVLAGVSLAACAAGTPPPVPAEPPSDACGAAALQYLVGRPQSALAAMTFPQTTRLIGPDMAVTMDYSAERLNIRYDRRGIITAVECG